MWVGWGEVHKCRRCLESGIDKVSIRLLVRWDNREKREREPAETFEVALCLSTSSFSSLSIISWKETLMPTPPPTASTHWHMYKHMYLDAHRHTCVSQLLCVLTA